MAHRRHYKAGEVPGPMATGKNLYPVIPYRYRMSLTATGTEAAEDVDFDLQFENSEVMDIFRVRVIYDADFDDLADGLNQIKCHLALFSDPNKSSTTDVSTAATFETDPSLIAWDTAGWLTDFQTSGMAVDSIARETVIDFLQPYTVARNCKLVATPIWTEADVVSISLSVEIYGRRREAKDEEYRNIMYRQNF